MISNLNNYLIIIIPITIVYLSNLIYPINKKIGKKISFRPPPIIFALVWPILLLLLGISWYFNKTINYYINYIYLFLTLLLATWYYLFTKNKYLGILNIIISILISLYLFLYKFNQKIIYSSLFLIPLIIWLIFAMILNIYSK